MNKEFCIMTDNPPIWYSKRFPGSHRHEIFFGNRNRKKSIEDGLVVFLRPELHNASNLGVHYNKQLDLELKIAGEKRWCEYYNKTPDEFRKRYGKNYL
jgi:hypothetical protein